MILVRTVFQAKFGKAGELVTALKENQASESLDYSLRILTDLSGPFDTVVLEMEVESLGAWEQARAKMFAEPSFAENMLRVVDLIASGRNEYYTIET